MELSQFSLLGKFDSPVEDNSLVHCPECQGWYGVKKWVRSSTAEGAVCPGCGTLFVTDQPFTTRPAVKLPGPVQEEKPDEETKPQGAVLINKDGSKTYQELNLEVKVNAGTESE